MRLPLAALAALLLLPACEDPEAPPTYDEQLHDSFRQAMRQHRKETEEECCAPRPQGDINAVDWAGETKLTELSERLHHVQDNLRDALRDEDAEGAADYREEIAELKAGILEQLRAGADPWARSVSRSVGKLAPCAIQYWSPEFRAELQAAGFGISDTPNTPAP